MRGKIKTLMLIGAVLASCGGGDLSGLYYLSPEEEKSVLFVREEEKLARDVYLSMESLYYLQTQTFTNISLSEQNHMDSVLAFIEKYQLEDPVAQTGDTQGVFVNPELQSMYDQLTSCGSVSLENALLVGAYIEELDIIDLTLRLQNTDNPDVRRVFTNLRKGSYNHLVAFAYSYELATGITYTPQILCQEDYDRVIQTYLSGGDLTTLEPLCDYTNVSLNFLCPTW